MKKLLSIAMFVMVLFGVTAAQAALIGIDLTGSYPDINFNNTGTVTYNATTDKYELRADDLKIAYADGTFEGLTDIFGNTALTKMIIDLYADENGNLIGTGTMVERVEYGSVTISGVTYNAGDVILGGEITAFGFYGAVGEKAEFDFLIENLYGGLITNGVWPDNLPTGIYVNVDSTLWDGTFTSDFSMAKVKGDKAPVPEPSTLVLIGLGLVGLGAYRKRMAKK